MNNNSKTKRLYRVISISVSLILIIGLFSSVGAASNKKKHSHTWRQIGIERVNVKKKGLNNYVYGGFRVPSGDKWSSYQGIAGGNSASYMTGKSMSINAKVSFSKSFLNGTLGYSQTTYKFKGVVGPKNKAQYKKDRYAKYFVVTQYRKHEIYADEIKQVECKTCNKRDVQRKNNVFQGYAWIPYGQVSGYVCSDKAGDLKKSKKMCLVADGISFEDGQFLVDKKGNVMRGPFSKNNQQFNTFSNVKYWNAN